MSYISDVAMVMITEQADEFREKLMYNELMETADIERDDNYTTFSWKKVEWYIYSPEVREIMDYMKGSGFDAYFVRIGEDVDDIEEKCYGDYDAVSHRINVKREIEIF